MILALLPPHRLDQVARRLQRLEGFPGMTVSEAKGHGREKGNADEDSAAQLTDFTPAARLEVVVSDALVEPVLEAIQTAAHTGVPGDGKVFVLAVVDALRIRTLERGERAI